MRQKPNFNVLFNLKISRKASIVAVAVASFLAFLMVKCDISEKDVLKYYNELRKLIKWDLPNNIIDEFDNQLNQRINKDPELLRQKIENEVDYAIINYEIEEQRSRMINMRNQNILEEINKPKYDNLQKLIVKNAIYYEFADGTMGIRGAWVAPDPREIPFE
jgi:anaerobic ribonucleoside-triphosphate reductase